MEKTIIVTAVDKPYAQYLGALRYSILQHASRPVEFYALTRGVGPEGISGFKCIDMDSNEHTVQFDKVALARWVSISTMDRLVLPMLLPDVKKVLYLDVDILVKGDISELFNMETGDCGIAARQSTRHGYITTTDYSSRTKADTGVLTEKYGTHPNFNAGVMLMDLDKMRRNNATHKMVEIVRTTRCNDQIAAATYSRGRFFRIGAEWNYWPAIDANVDAKLIHYIGSKKPWQYTNNEWYSVYTQMKRDADAKQTF